VYIYDSKGLNMTLSYTVPERTRTFLIFIVSAYIILIFTFSNCWAQQQTKASKHWVLSGTNPHQVIGENPYYPKSGSINSGSCSGTVSWRDNDEAYGSYTFSFQWTPPPASLKPGEEFTINGTVSAEVTQTSGGRYIGASLSTTSQASGINNHLSIAELPGGWHSSQGAPPDSKGSVKFIAPSPEFGNSFWVEVSPYWGEDSRVVYIYSLVEGNETENTSVTLNTSGMETEQKKMPEVPILLELTFPLGESPKVFDTGWKFGARCILNKGTKSEKDISGSVEWSGTAAFNPSKGAASFPAFKTIGANTIKLKVKLPGGEYFESDFTIIAVDSKEYATKGSLAFCGSDAHNCPSCPHAVSGLVKTGAPDVMINGSPAARKGDGGTHLQCCGSNTFTIEEGDPEVLILGIPAAKYGSKTKHCGGTGTLIK